MFQTYTSLSSPETGRERVESLRACFDDLGIDAFIIPRADAFQGEYVPASEMRLAWLTGFTGSAGLAVVTREAAYIFVDGRYTAQVRLQVDLTVFTVVDLVEQPLPEWLAEQAKQDWRVGIDPWLHAHGETRRIERALAGIGATLVSLSDNPIDTIWLDRPAAPNGAVAIHPLAHAGVLAKDKIGMLAEDIEHAGADLFVMTDPSSIAWTFNIRGSDVPHTPHPLARALLRAKGRPTLFIEAEKLNIEVRAYLTQLADLAEPEDMPAALTALVSEPVRIGIDAQLTPQAVMAPLQGAAKIVEMADPARLRRAIKNDTELAGSRAAHRVDGVAVVAFLAWLDGCRPGTIDEISAARRLETLRSEIGAAHQSPLKDISFETIAGSGPNGAIIHYRVNEASNRVLGAGELFLVDSGGQYLSGTTDITRTVAIGEPTAEMRRFFTLVLKGMIAISTARFPKGTRGIDLDPLARIALWKAGADYAHGTGHGVGSYLSVHEGPQSISRRGMQLLEPGMILSNEPGYYRDDAFGIRIENLIAVTAPDDIEGGDRAMMGFETLTLCPIDRRLIDPALLTSEEIAWLDAYHARVGEALGPLISDEAVSRWLTAATRPLSRSSGAE
jgi:Xaa-Pro aminopeptidase